MIRRDDRGATLIIVAAFSVVAMIMMAFVIDIGGLRAEKKEVTLSTDAAALAAVSVIDYADPDAFGSDKDCSLIDSLDRDIGGVGMSPTVEDVAVHYLTENGQSTFGSCRIFFGAPGLNQAYLTVTATEVRDYTFGQVIGSDSGLVTATSSARAGSASIGDVYPIGICGPEPDGPNDFINDNAPFPQNFDGNESVTIDFGNTNCGGAGNHDQINFVGGSGACPTNIEGKFSCDIINGGYEGTIPAIVDSDTGGGGWNGQGLEPPLEDLRDRAVHIWVPVVGDCHEVPGQETTCPGTGARYPVKYLMEVVITYFKANGNNPPAGFTFEVYQVVDYDYYAAFGLPSTSVNQAVEAHICATSADVSGCTNNPSPVAPPPPPPPPSCDVSSVSASDTTPPVDDSTGTLDAPGPVTVNVQFVDITACNLLDLIAVRNTGGEVDATETGTSGNVRTYEFPVGAPLGVPGTVLTLEVRNNGTVRDDGTTLTTVSSTPPPPCTLSASPANQTVKTTSNNGGNQVFTTQAVVVEVAVPNPGSCGTISMVATIGSNNVTLTGTGPAASTMTFRLENPTQLPNGQRNGFTFTMTVRNNGAQIGNQPTFTSSYP